MAIIQTKSLTKRYGLKNSVCDISLTANEGEIYGFLGLNGAGKTTTMRMLLKMVRPTSGEIYYSGQSISKLSSEFWNQIGYLIETPHAYPNFTVEENLTLYAKQRLIPDLESFIAMTIIAIGVTFALGSSFILTGFDLSLDHNLWGAISRGLFRGFI